MNATPDPAAMSAIQDHARELYKQLEPMAQRFLFEKPPPTSEISATPMVLLLGNHSSGKSSFINYLLGHDVQRTGIAPVDDGFTILTYGERPMEKDGTAVVTNPDLGWEDLKKFGDTLVGRLKMRTHQSLKFSDIALIDSPGMIDSGDIKTDRGYDFPRVVRWFAERADVVLFLFDPDKPGTTGETLRVLKESLDGLDHKVLLVFNKVDRFAAMRDFARAYGALCWNLARTYTRKDLPHIYNTYIPQPEGAPDAGHVLPLDDFSRAREEVVEEVRRAPLRRIDNVVSRLYRYTRRLKIYGAVLTQRKLEHKRHSRYYMMIGGAVVVLALVLGYGATQAFEESFAWVGVVAVLAILALGGIVALSMSKKPKSTLDQLFKKAFAKPLALEDQADELTALWVSVRDQVKLALRTGDSLGSLSRGDLRRLDKIIDVEVPELRTRAKTQIDTRDIAN